MVRSVSNTCSCDTCQGPDLSGALSSWGLSSDWSGCSSGGPTYGREIHRSPCSPCGSVGRRCFACYPRDARDAEGRAVDRAQVRDAHERLGSDSEVVMLEQESDGMHGPRVTSLSNGGTGEFFLSRRLVQLDLQAEHRQCHVKPEESTREFTDAQKIGPGYAT